MMRPLAPALFVVVALSCTACGRPETEGADAFARLGDAASSALRLTLQDSDDSAPLPDARGGQLQEARAIVHAVSAHVAGRGWLPLMEGRVELDFLRLAESDAELGIAALPSGKITQLRLYVLEDEAAYVIDSAGERHSLLTPSGSESGIKLKGTWDVGPCATATLSLATRASKAIHIHGRGADGSYVLRPVIRVDALTTAPIDGCSAGAPGAGDDGAPGEDDEADDTGPGRGDGDGEPGDFDPEGGGPGVDLGCAGDDDIGATDDDGLGPTNGCSLSDKNDEQATDSGESGASDAADDVEENAVDGGDEAGLCYDPEASAFFPCS